jgi:outer membrane protein insertion porin family
MGKFFRLKAICLAIVIFSNSAFASEKITSIRVKGLQRIEPETVTSYINLRKGDEITNIALDKSLKQLFATDFFADVRIDVLDGGIIVINVIESPVVNQVIFEGNEKLDTKSLEAETTLKPRSLYSRSKIQEDTKRLISVYKRAGRFAAKINPTVVQKDQNRIDVVYEIDEGPTANIRKINFIGNKRYTDEDLKDEILSEEKRWFKIFSSSDTYDPEKMNYDKEMLRRFYLKNGYADFKVVSAVSELTPNKKSFIMTFVVEEGARYKVGDIKIVSEIEDVNVSNLYPAVKLEKNKWYNALKLEKSIDEITDKLGEEGYAFVDVSPAVNQDEENSILDVTFKINESKKVFVNRINIEGNYRTLDRVIRREFKLDEGDAFNVNKLRASKKNIKDLNYFSKVDIKPVATNVADKTDIDVKLEEKSTGNFNVGIGWSSVYGAMIKTGIAENNFLGKGQKLALDLGFSTRQSNYNISFTEPYFMDRKLRAGFDLFYTTTDYQDEASYDKEVQGGRIRTGWNYTDDLSHSLSYTLRSDEITNVDDDASVYIKDEEGKNIVSMIGQNLTLDKRDSRINPKEGYVASLGADLAGVGGDDKFVKIYTKAATYYTVADHFTFKLFGNAGYIYGLGGENIRLSQRYYLGGNTMRGFSFAGIGARDIMTDDALGGNWMFFGGTEMSFPLGLDDLGVKGRTFIDVGMLGKPDNMNEMDVEYSSTPRVAVGAGVQWTSPMGVVNIDFGVPIVKEEYDETETIRINFGTGF